MLKHYITTMIILHYVHVVNFFSSEEISILLFYYSNENIIFLMKSINGEQPY
jgi:hypothetical protein